MAGESANAILETIQPAITLLGLGIGAALVSRACRLNPIVGYLVMGLGLSALGFKDDFSGPVVATMAEAGVMFLLFNLGLHFSLGRIWAEKGNIFGFGSPQMLVAGGAFALVFFVIGLPPAIAIIGGFAMGLSSTAVVIGLDGDAGKGSGRSVGGVDLGAAIQRLASEGHLLKGGGHRMAAGLTVARNALEPAMARLSDLLAKQGAGSTGPSDLRLDGVLMPGAATPEMIDQIETAGPFGQGAPAPRFAFPDQRILDARRVGETHLKVSFGDGTGPRLDAIAFSAFDGPLGPGLQGHGGMRFHLAGRLEINHWQGRARAQLRLSDASPAS